MAGKPPNRDVDGLDQLCWSCRTSIDQRTGLSLARCDGYGSLQVCAECWEQIPIADRIKLQWLFRSKGAEGSGLVDLIEDGRQLVKALREHRIDELLGGDDDDP